MLELNNNFLQLEIDPQGAYITSFKAEDQDIFFPRTQLDYNGTSKNRGGSHVCLPQFGAAGEFNLKSHGFGREILWQVESQTEDNLTILASKVAGEYEELESRLSFALVNSELEIILSVKNNGENPLAVSPAFHPYFNVADQEEIKIDGETIDITEDKFADSVYVNSPKLVETELFSLELEYENLPVTVLWTDKKADYFCIEPTYNSISFSKGEGYLTLGAGESATFKYKVSVSVK